ASTGGPHPPLRERPTYRPSPRRPSGSRPTGSGAIRCQKNRSDPVYPLTRFACSRPRLNLNPPVRVPDHPAPRSAGMAGRERIGTDLVHVVAARRLPLDDLPGAFDRVGVVDAFALAADPEYGDSRRSWRPGPPERIRAPRLT